jgi:hypothetical protein
MTFLGSLSASDKQDFTFPRRKLPGKLLAIASLLLLPRTQSQPKSVETQPQPAPVDPQPSVTKSSYSSPKFKIGDLIASDWLDEFDENMTDFGEVLGSRYLPEGHSCYQANTWVYYINWTHSTSGCYSCYPCYDGEPSRECDLRSVSQSEGVK